MLVSSLQFLKPASKTTQCLDYSGSLLRRCMLYHAFHRSSRMIAAVVIPILNYTSLSFHINDSFDASCFSLLKGIHSQEHRIFQNNPTIKKILVCWLCPNRGWSSTHRFCTIVRTAPTRTIAQRANLAGFSKKSH